MGSWLVGGAVLGLGHAFARDDDGFFKAQLDRMESDHVAITSTEVDLGSEPGNPRWAIDALDTDVRLRVTSTSAEHPVFVGIAEQDDVDRYLDGAGRDEVWSMRGNRPLLRGRDGGSEVAAPGSEAFWAVSTSGTGEQEVVWPATQGRWAAVVMNADGSPGLAVDVEVGAKPGVPAAAGPVDAGVGDGGNRPGRGAPGLRSAGTRARNRPWHRQARTTGPTERRCPVAVSSC